MRSKGVSCLLLARLVGLESLPDKTRRVRRDVANSPTKFGHSSSGALPREIEADRSISLFQIR